MMKMDKEEARFRQSFQLFPSSFNLEIKELKSSKKIELYKKKLEAKISSDEFESTTEQVRIYNLLSFLCWSENERDDAYSYNMKALELDKENMVSLCNKLWMRREEGYLAEANEELKKLVKLAESNNNLLLTGKAEIAHCYPVFGPSYFLKSKDMLEDVLRKLSDKDIHPDTLTLWKLDLGIIYRKLCNFGNMPKEGWEKRDEEEFIKRGAQLLYEVACSDSSARWRGKCWASLAELLFRTSKGDHLNKYLTEQLFPQKVNDIGVAGLLDLAMKTCDNDSQVLKISGKLYRYLKKLDKAEEVLRKSLSIRNTSYAHHHLALILKQKLKDRVYAKRGYNNDARDIYIPVSTCIRHKTFLGNMVQGAKNSNVPSRSSVGHDRSKQEFFQTKTRTTVERNEKSVSATSERERSIKYSTGQTDSTLQHTSTEKSTRSRAKGLDRVFSIPEDEMENVQVIQHHLNEAIKLGNGWASLEKGVVLRHIRKFKEARDVFLMTLKMKDRITAILEVSCYENLGACCRDIAEQETDLEQRRKFEIDAVIYWRKALEKIASTKDKTLDFPKEEWMSYPVLKDMFQHRKQDVAMLKALADLGEILERPAETRSFIQEIRKLGGDEANDPTIISCEIKTLLTEYRYDDAAQMLDKSETKGIVISRNFRLRVYLECAFYLVTMGKTIKAGERFQQAFHLNSIAKSKFDIFLLYDEDTEADKTIAVLAKKLDEYLSGYFGLRITRNSQNVDPGKQRWEIQTEQMKSSKHIVLIMDTNEVPPGDFKYFIGIVQGISKTEQSFLNIILVDECTCPLQLTVFPTMHFKSKQLNSDDDFIQWIRDFIFHLLRVHNNED